MDLSTDLSSLHKTAVGKLKRFFPSRFKLVLKVSKPHFSMLFKSIRFYSWIDQLRFK